MTADTSYLIGFYVVIIIVSFLFILLIRELVCWYFKINLVRQDLGNIATEIQELHTIADRFQSNAMLLLSKASSLLDNLNDTTEKQLDIIKTQQGFAMKSGAEPLIPAKTIVEEKHSEEEYPTTDFAGIPRREDETDKQYWGRVLKERTGKNTIIL